MYRPLYHTALVLGLAAMAWVPVSLRAQSSANAPALKAQPSTSDTYLQGYLIMLEGDKLQKKGDYAGAYFKFRDARDIFDSVHTADPSWQPDIIDYRRRKIREGMEEVRQLEVQRRAAGGPPSASGVLGDPKKDGPAKAGAEIPAREEVRAPKTPASLMEERMKGLYEKISQLEKRNESILKDLTASETARLNTGQELLNSKTSEKALLTRLKDAEAKLETAGAAEKRNHKDLLKKVDELTNALKDANEKLAAANAAREQMAADLAYAVGEMKKLSADKAALIKERDQMMGLLTGEGGAKGLEKMKIIDENQRLKKELAAATEKVSQLSTAKEKDRAEIAALKQQVRTVQDSLASVQQENDDYRQQLATLTTRLDATSKQLADSSATGVIPESDAVRENQMLREIVLQQLKQQARRERARQNIMEELTREGVFDKMKEMGVESDNLLRAVNEMAAPVLLSKEQRDILTSSQVNKLLTSADGKELIMVQDSSADAPSPEIAPPASGAPDKAGLSTELKAYANAAEQLFAAGDYSQAENNFRKILLVEPQNVYALCNLGVTQLRLGSNEEAARTLLKALAYKYENEFAHYARGVALLRIARLDDAVEELQEGIKINDKNAAAWHTLGVIAIKRGRREEGKGHFLKAVELDPHCAEAHFNLAIIFATTDPPQLETARRHYKLAINSGAARDSDLDKLLGRR